MQSKLMQDLQDGKSSDADNKPIPLAGEHKQAELADFTYGACTVLDKL